MKKIVLLGSTGSIGTQALDVIRLYKDRFQVLALSTHQNISLLQKQDKEFSPKILIVTDEKAGKQLCREYSGSARILVGEEALCEAVAETDADIALISVVGIAGLRPTLAAIESGKDIALANKETLVAGGELVMDAAKRNKAVIRPIDSEHSAIFQCMLGQDVKNIHKIILTASGGPFLGKTTEELKYVTMEEALLHPVWHMGIKVTLDSATLFNKGLEVIEAKWLFHVPYSQIEVVVQPQSLIHSMVEYADGSILAQLGEPDMRIPIQFALTYPERCPSPSKRFVDWTQIGSLRFEKPNRRIFRSLDMAYFAGNEGGDMPASFNAANEEAILGFMNHSIHFLDIFDVVEHVLTHRIAQTIHSVEDIEEADREARIRAREYMETLKK